MDPLQPRPAPDPSPSGEPAWKAVLSGASPREVLARLVDGDPLDLRARCAERVRSQAILLEERLLHLRAVAYVARHAPAYRGAPAFEIWIADKIRLAVRDLLVEAEEELLSGAVPQAPQDERLLLVARVLGIEPELMARGCVAFNGAPYEVRAAFWGMVLEHRSPLAWAQQNASTPERARAALRRALWVLGVRDRLDLDELLGEVDDDG